MTRSRNVASVLALLILLTLLVMALRVSVPYTIYRPGPTFDVLGTSGKSRIIDVSGRKTYHDDGQLRMVTIIPTGPTDRVSLIAAIGAWIDPNDDLYPTAAVYQKGVSNKQENEQDAQEMVSSQDSAVAAALHQLGIKYAASVRAESIAAKTPAAGKLRAGDLLLAVDGTPTSTPEAVVKQVRPKPPGTTLSFRVERAGKERTIRLTTVAAGTTNALRHQSRVGVVLAPAYRFPFQVKLHVSSNIGGPSAGMMFALGIYDTLTPGSLTAGKAIAGTGTIDAKGTVGEIGGIQQKIPGAQHDGAKLFLVPAGNCAEAVQAHYDSHKMRLAKVSTLSGAIKVIRTWTKNPSAALPRCTS